MRLKEAEIYLSPSKCDFMKAKFEVLGHVCSKEGISPNPKKVKAVVEYPCPVNRAELRRFLGMSVWVCQFIRNFSKNTSHLQSMLHGKGVFHMAKEELREFEHIRNEMMQAPVLVHPDYENPFHIHVDSIFPSTKLPMNWIL